MDQVLFILFIVLQLSIGIVVFSYGDELVFGIIVDYDVVFEMQQLVNGIELGVVCLVVFSDDFVLLFIKDWCKCLFCVFFSVVWWGWFFVLIV